MMYEFQLLVSIMMTTEATGWLTLGQAYRKAPSSSGFPAVSNQNNKDGDDHLLLIAHGGKEEDW